MPEQSDKAEKAETLETQNQINARRDQDLEDNAEWGPEEKRLRGIRAKRQKAGECIMCGKPLGFWDKRFGRLRHDKCEVWRE